MGSVAEASAKTSDSAASTEGESMSQEDSGKKSGTVTTSADEAAAPKINGKQGKKGKGGHGPKAPNQVAQKDNKFEMLKEAFAKKNAEVAKKTRRSPSCAQRLLGCAASQPSRPTENQHRHPRTSPSSTSLSRYSCIQFLEFRPRSRRMFPRSQCQYQEPRSFR